MEGAVKSLYVMKSLKTTEAITQGNGLHGEAWADAKLSMWAEGSLIVNKALKDCLASWVCARGGKVSRQWEIQSWGWPWEQNNRASRAGNLLERQAWGNCLFVVHYSQQNSVTEPFLNLHYLIEAPFILFSLIFIFQSQCWILCLQ